MRRADAPDGGAAFWQPVTGTKAHGGERWAETAVREVVEETGIDCALGSVLAGGPRDWGLERQYEVYPWWHPRYAPGVTGNIEHVLGLCVCVPAGTPARLNPREHGALRWRATADACFSFSNAGAISWPPRFVCGA